MQNNNDFTTEDMFLAAYLRTEGYQLLGITKVREGIASFRFERPPQEVLNEWVEGNPKSPTKRVISTYRYLARRAREVANG